MTVRLAIVTDIHHGAPTTTKCGDTALTLLDDFARFVADARPDHVLELGDRISDLDATTDRRLAGEVASALRPVREATTGEVLHLCGNHDRDHLSVAENEDILGQSLGHAMLDVGDWRLVLWRADTRIRRGPEHRGFVLVEEDLVWLSRTVQAARRPLLVLSHVPVSGHSQTGNYYFEQNPRSATYPGAERIRAALALARVPVVCLAGHVHWNTITTVDGITHLTQQSLTESFTTQGEPAGAFGLIELGQTVRWTVQGADPVTFGFTPTAHRWTPRLPVFSDHPGLAERPRERV